MMSVQASCHQGRSDHNGAGKQCTVMCLAAMMYSKKKTPDEWDTNDLDSILLDGDNIYKRLGYDKCLLISELPCQLDTYYLKILDCYSGTVNRAKTETPFYSLFDSLKAIKLFCFLTIGCYTVAVIHCKGTYYVFDSHSRDEDGLPSADGKATVTSHNTLQNLISFICHLSSMLSENTQCFEVSHALLTTCTDLQNDEFFTQSSSEFSGFSTLSDGEFTCRMYLIQEQKENTISSILQTTESVSEDSIYSSSSFISDTEQSEVKFLESNGMVDVLVGVSESRGKVGVSRDDSYSSNMGTINVLGNLNESRARGKVEESGDINEVCAMGKVGVSADISESRDMSKVNILVNENKSRYIGEGDELADVGEGRALGEGVVFGDERKSRDMDEGDVLEDESMSRDMGKGDVLGDESKRKFEGDVLVDEREIRDMGKVNVLVDGSESRNKGEGDVSGDVVEGKAISKGDVLGDESKSRDMGEGDVLVDENERRRKCEGDVFVDESKSRDIGKMNVLIDESESRDVGEGDVSGDLGEGNAISKGDVLGDEIESRDIGEGGALGDESESRDMCRGDVLGDAGKGRSLYKGDVLGDVSKGKARGDAVVLRDVGEGRVMDKFELLEGETEGRTLSEVEFSGDVGEGKAKGDDKISGDDYEFMARIDEDLNDIPDETLEQLNDSATFLNSIDLNLLEETISTDSDTLNYLSSENENMPLSFLVKKSQRAKQKKKKKQTDLDLSINNVVVENENITAHQNIRSRKREKIESEWKRNVAKRRRNQGQSYVNKHGDIRQSRQIKPGCNFNCKFKCHSNFSKDDREEIFTSYWKLGCLSRQRQFLLKFSRKNLKNRSKNRPSRRKYSYKFYLPVKNSTQRCCKQFFLHTLSLSQKVIEHVHSNVELPGVASIERRGSADGSRSNKTPLSSIENVCKHIESFPTIDSHYCRKDSNKQYLDSSLSLRKMFDLYCQYCSENQMPKVKIHTYRKIFNSKYNISFHKPIKDQCDICTSYKNSSEQDKVKHKTHFDNHIFNKAKVREHKEYDKQLAKQDRTLSVACFDLQEVLLTPKAFASSFYYKRRLNSYNFTIYSLGTSDGYSYLWNETIAGRGSNEIASCVFHFIKEHAEKGMKKFFFFQTIAFHRIRTETISLCFGIH